MKKLIVRILYWVDNNLNHNLIEKYLDSNEAIAHTCFRYCQWTGKVVYHLLGYDD